MYKSHTVVGGLVLLILAQFAFAQPSVTVTGVTLTSDGPKTYNSKAAVCTANKAAGLTVAATFTPTFTTGGEGPEVIGSCTSCNAVSGSGCTGDALKLKVGTITNTAVRNQSVAATATDGPGDTVGLTGTNTSQSGTLPLTLATTDGLITTTVSATASEERQTQTKTRIYTYNNAGGGGCGGGVSTTSEWSAYSAWSVWTPYTSTPAATNSAQYYLDIQAPTLSHTLDAPTTVPQGGSINFNMTASGGSSQSSYTMQPKGTGPGTINGPTTTDNFATDTSDGIAADVTKAASLSIPLAATPGLYTSAATLTNTFDLCGNSWGTINSSSSPTFVVESASSSCTNEAVVTAPLTGTPEGGGPTGYELVDCFNTVLSGKGKQKVVSDPGTVHVGTIVKTACGDEYVTDVKVELEIPSNFNFECSGKSPAIHVFAGVADTPAVNPLFEYGFYFHSGSPLAEITGLLKAALNGIVLDAPCDSAHRVTADLSKIDVGFGLGKIPAGWTIYARAHTRPNSSSTGDSTFTTKAEAVDFSQIVATKVISENNPSCTNGQLP